MRPYKPSELRVVAIAVAFDVTRDLNNLLTHAPDAVDHLIIVDNSADGHPELINPAPSGCTVIHNRNNGGLAGAYNVALLMVRQRWPETTHVLFLDDDSDTSVISRFFLSEATRNATTDPRVAAVAPIYKERETGLRCRHVKLDRFYLRWLGRDIAQPTDVTFIVNSMSLWRMDALAALGTYSTELAVDHIDTEYCLRAQKAGFRIVLNPTVEFLHSIGKRRAYRLFGYTIQSCGYGAERRYMIARNQIILLRRYVGAFPALALLSIIRLAYEATGIVMIEDDRPRKLRALFRGAWAGLVYRHGL